jgi:hypothetical protein
MWHRGQTRENNASVTDVGDACWVLIEPSDAAFPDSASTIRRRLGSRFLAYCAELK